MARFQHILVPTDFSETADCALDYARELAKQFSATLHLLHVTPDAYTQPWMVEGARLSIPNLLETWERDARRRLDELGLPDAHTRLNVATGDPSVEIVRYAKSHEIDLIVMGTHGRGAVAHMLLGSVAEKVVRTASCPVLTVRHPEHRFTMPADEDQVVGTNTRATAREPTTEAGP